MSVVFPRPLESLPATLPTAARRPPLDCAMLPAARQPAPSQWEMLPAGREAFPIHREESYPQKEALINTFPIIAAGKLPTPMK